MRFAVRLLLREIIALIVWIVIWTAIGWVVGIATDAPAWMALPISGAIHGLIAGIIFVLLSAVAYGKRHEVSAPRGAVYAMFGGIAFFVVLRILLGEFSLYIPLLVLPIDGALGCGLCLFLFRTSLPGTDVRPIAAFQNIVAWVGWIIVGVFTIGIWRAPDSAMHAYTWALRKTLSPVTSMQELDNFPIDESDFNAPKNYYPENSGIWVGEILKWFREPSIYEENSHPAVRLVYDRSFFDPVLVRLSYENGKWFLVAKRVTAGVHIPLHLDLDKKVEVSESLVNHLKKSLDRIGFWSMPTFSEDRGLDGAEWVLEARLNGRYHVVDQWSPNDKDEYKKLCVWLLKEGGVADGPLF